MGTRSMDGDRWALAGCACKRWLQILSYLREISRDPAWWNALLVITLAAVGTLDAPDG
ncbi:hypothetical protein J2X98_004010 [Pseudarthrobacter enclensis]|jgi:hypothetical protein|uniref:Transposase n=1 Tax=Pseudarthrobacter enclensis TaxID=993070 RepID=A0ABT9S007_9MICC|nr:hypothetical protein [Pseudarthrobacter enclensis]